MATSPWLCQLIARSNDIRGSLQFLAAFEDQSKAAISQCVGSAQEVFEEQASAARAHRQFSMARHGNNSSHGPCSGLARADFGSHDGDFAECIASDRLQAHLLTGPIPDCQVALKPLSF